MLAATLVVACSSGSDAKSAPKAKDTTTSSTRASTTDDTRPPGPAARISGPLTGGNGINLASASTGPAVPTSGWVEGEYAAAGTATSYTSAGPLPADGHYRLTEGPTAAVPHPHRRAPAAPARRRSTAPSSSSGST